MVEQLVPLNDDRCHPDRSARLVHGSVVVQLDAGSVHPSRRTIAEPHEALRLACNLASLVSCDHRHPRPARGVERHVEFLPRHTGIVAMIQEILLVV